MSELEKVKLVGARVLVKEDKLSEETSSGIIIPERSKQQTNKGTVIMIGDGAILENGIKIPMQVSVGDKVVYSSFSGSPVKVSSKDEDTYLILNERDILCIFEE